MWWLIPISGLVLGVYVGGVLDLAIPAGMVKYLSIAILASLDSVFGGIKAMYEKNYDNVLMLSGFATNALLAAFLTYIGDMLGIDLHYAAIFAFGVRLFGNLSMIRIHIIGNLRERERILRKYSHELDEGGDGYPDDGYSDGGYSDGEYSDGEYADDEYPEDYAQDYDGQQSINYDEYFDDEGAPEGEDRVPGGPDDGAGAGDGQDEDGQKDADFDYVRIYDRDEVNR